MGQFALGQSVPRTEDPRLLKGQGLYVDDLCLPREAHAYFVRSSHGHGVIRTMDPRAAQQMPGILGVFTGEDWVADNMGHFGLGQPRIRRNGETGYCPPRPALVQDKVLFAGDAVAIIIAETLNQAKDAAERFEMEVEPLESLTVGHEARVDGAPVLWPECPDNEAFFYQAGDKNAVESALKSAHHVTHISVVINRITANTMEPRAAIGDYDKAAGQHVLYGASQRPFGVRRQIAQNILGVPETSVRVVAGDVGGSFGMKSGQYPEYNACLWAASKVGRPVRWVADRSEGHLSDYHDRDQSADAWLGLDENGKFLALKVLSTCAVGAYLDPGGMISPANHVGGLAGTYLTPHIYTEASAVFTNTAPIGPYRGAGRPEATYIVESIIDRAAREMNLDRAEIRRINSVPPEAMPFKTGLIYTLDSGDFPRNLEEALKMGDYDGFEKRREEAKERGRLRGIGIANFIEQTAQMEGETIRVQFDPSGTATVIAGSISHGQGHDTMYKVILSDRLGIDVDNIRVAFGDTNQAPWGNGTYSSRTAVLGGNAIAVAADKVIYKGIGIAAHMLEAARGDIEFTCGEYKVAGTDKSVHFTEVARAAYQPGKIPPNMEPGLMETATFDPGAPTFPNGTHVVEVEIDPETGKTEILKYSVVDDVGTVINKLTLEGQIHGGIGQAVGQTLSERIVYDEAGQMLTGSFLDYGMPRADDMCFFDCANNPVPTPVNPLGIKGAGEAGNVGGLAAIMNAVLDALNPVGVTHIDMPATPQKVWAALREAQRG
ncbi:MAG: xanthine dehydrogenase family protein molybdopterin-binding subunit [Pseudomonadota bacterium]|nr:xanthine dehydrogenase family protein molybdopterin-binding subunit [Pseudomonadota bacterium]